jgi:DNA-binding transcriptional LysR family regulator
MQSSRRFIPPVQWLTAFEAVARLGSVTAAAQELNLTQGAVSRQVQKLEEQLQAELFRRERKRLYLTPQGEAFAEAVRGGLSQISNAAVALHAGSGGGVLNLAILPAFGAHWLAPRLPAFLKANPGVTVNLATRPDPFDFAREDLHGAIHFGRGPWPGTDGVKLWDEDILAVVAPSLAGREGLRPKDIGGLPRLQLQSRPDAWEEWFKACGTEVQGGPAMVVDQFATLVQAALSGLGAALVPRYLITEELAAGRLLAVSCPAVSIGAYYLVWPEGSAGPPALQALGRWLAGQSAEPFS